MVQYAKSSKAIGRFLNSGRIGAIGHISCIDRRAGHGGSLTGDRMVDEVVAAGASQLWQICTILGFNPVSAAARFSREGDGACLQVFLQLDARTVVHYFATFDDDPCGHQLWIEGAGGSLKTDGNSVWWRKRGWPKFLPVRIGIFGARSGTPDPSAPDSVLDAVAESVRSREVVEIAHVAQTASRK